MQSGVTPFVMNKNRIFARMNPALAAASLCLVVGGLILSPSFAATTASSIATRVYVPRPSTQRLAAVVMKATGVRPTEKVPDTLKEVAKLVGALLTNPETVVPTDGITGKCNGETVCPECHDACANYKYGMAFVVVLEAINDDGAQDQAIDQIEDYIFNGLNDFGCTCRGI